MNACKWMFPASANARDVPASNSNVISSAPGARLKWTSAPIAAGIGSTRGNWPKDGWKKEKLFQIRRLGEELFHPRSSAICTGSRQTAAREATAIEFAGGEVRASSPPTEEKGEVAAMVTRPPREGTRPTN